jgi:hypothetical protein
MTLRYVIPHVAMPPIGAHVHVRRPLSEGDEFQAAIVVGHLHDPELGAVLELRLSDSSRMQRVWPSPSLRLPPTA